LTVIAAPIAASDVPGDAILDVVRRYWGFDQLRPQQETAIAAGLEGRDALVVLPTGGGKSLCYQVPPAVAERTDVVVSPLIALMKDQVDGLRENGYRPRRCTAAWRSTRCARSNRGSRRTATGSSSSRPSAC
jgi:superfamily II DNA helicase RecQ